MRIRDLLRVLAEALPLSRTGSARRRWRSLSKVPGHRDGNRQEKGQAPQASRHQCGAAAWPPLVRDAEELLGAAPCREP